ncbi:hypothetical protein DRW03_28910 [Corallococcus sp. H22C18031201]|nr:hypothetical protein DRW03_28910 [Corallococcus sp. H22C18031201]
MRSLLVLLLLWLVPPRAMAQEDVGGPHGIHEQEAVVRDTALVPHTRPALVTGELGTRRFRILHTTRATGAARRLAAQIEDIRDAFGQMLGRDWPGTTEIRIGVGREEFDALALPGGKPPGWAVALAYPAHQIILLDALSLNAPDGPTTLRHELAHVALGQLAPSWPHWFQEGVAQNLTEERYSVTHYAALFRAVTQERVFHFEDLSNHWPDVPSDVEIAYAQSAAFVGFLISRHGPEAMGQLVDGVRAQEPFELAFGKAFHSSLEVEEKDWRHGLSARYGWLPLTTSSALLWLVASGLCVAAFLRRRHQKAAKMAELAAEDAAEDAALRLLAAAQAAPEAAPPSDAQHPWPEWHSANTPPTAQPEARDDGAEAREGSMDRDASSDLDSGDADAGGGDDDTPSRPSKPTLH